LVIKPDLKISTKGIFSKEKIAEIKGFADIIANALTQGISDSFSSLGEGIGNVLSGKSFGSGILDAFSVILKSIGLALIKYGIIKTGLDKILGAGGIVIPGAVAIGLGIFAIAASQLVKNIGHRASGGPVSAGLPYLVGERGPELFQPNTGGRIVSNSLSGSGMTGGGITISGVIQNILSGKDILQLITLQTQSNNRLI
jgi:phage-related minor tail protein